jgi:predicted transcriptional regulator
MDGRVVTAVLPENLVLRMDKFSKNMDRSNSWIIRQAVAEWLAEEERRHQLTLEAMKSVDEGHTFTQEEVEAMVEERKRDRRKRHGL